MADKRNELGHTCAIHDVVITSLTEKIDRLHDGQKETQALVKSSHEEVIQHILKIAQLHREDIQCFKQDINHEIDEMRARYDARFTRNDEVLAKLKIRIAQASAAALALGAAGGFFFKHLETILMIFKPGM